MSDAGATGARPTSGRAFRQTLAQRLLAAVAIAAMVVTAAPAAAQERPIAIGVFAYQGERAAVSDWSPLLDYLKKALPERDFRLDTYDADDLRKAAAEHRVDLVITNPGYYVTLENELGLSRIATLDSPPGTSSRAIGSVVITRADRPDLRELSDLAGKSVAAVSPQAFGGYLVAARELLKLGIDPESDLRELRFLGLPMSRIVEAVKRGEVDAGIVRMCLPEQMASLGQLRLTELRVLSPRAEEGGACGLSTPLYPNWPIAVTRQTDPALAKAVARALLAMPAGAGGISWSVTADYQPVLELYRELRLGPYAHLRDIAPEALARRFWPWLLGLTGLLIAWIIHTVRVEYLVHRRTAELEESLRARERAEARVRENQQQMEHLSRLSILGELSGNLAHEINQPLTTIGTYARSVLRRQAGGNLTPEAVGEACREIADEAERAGGILQRIRHFARKRSAVRDPVDVVAIAEEARRLILGILAQAPEISIEAGGVADCQALADGPQIQQVLLNLVKNAVDAGRELPPARQTIRVVIEHAPPWLVVSVIDRGPGLAPAELAHLFEPFFTTKSDGLGLGLSICKTIVEAHGGRLWAEPNADLVGMRFAFSLPCHDHPA